MYRTPRTKLSLRVTFQVSWMYDSKSLNRNWPTVTAELCPSVLKFPSRASAKGSPVVFEPMVAVFVAAEFGFGRLVAPALGLKLIVPSKFVRKFCVLRFRQTSAPNLSEWLPFSHVTLSAGFISVVGDARKFGAGPFTPAGAAVGKFVTAVNLIAGAPLGNVVGFPSGGMNAHP